MVRSADDSDATTGIRGVPTDTRRLSFGARAGDYDRFRPSYPTAAVDWAMGTQPLKVVDLAAGTGAMTRVLLERGHSVTAVEPDPGMRAQLEATPHDALTVVEGSAESMPLQDNSADAVIVAQAFHWFEREQAVPEIWRVLRPGGVLAITWNRRDDTVAWVERMSEIVGRYDARSGNRHTSVPDLAGYFTTPEQALFTHLQQLDAESLVQLADTYSYVTLSADRDVALSAIRDLARTHPDLAGRASFDLPYETVVYRSQRVEPTS